MMVSYGTTIGLYTTYYTNLNENIFPHTVMRTRARLYICHVMQEKLDKINRLDQVARNSDLGSKYAKSSCFGGRAMPGSDGH